MRSFFSVATILLLVLMAVVYFQNLSVGDETELYFLTSAQSVSAADAMLYAYIFGAGTALFAILFVTGGRIEFLDLPKRGEKEKDDEWK